MSLIRVGVVGVGHHGRHHARNLASMPGVHLVGVVDAHESAARQVADDCQTEAFSAPADLLNKVDAVSIAVPTVAHHAVASLFLRRGIAALVEKPLSLSTDEGRDLVRMAQKHQTNLMVGHIERFNPAWSAMADSSQKPRHVSTMRLSRFPFRSLDVSVVFDVMIHDIDLLLSVARSPIRTIRAVGNEVLSPSLDWVEAHLELENGTTAQLSASRVHHTTERRMTVRTVDESVEIDFLRRTSLRSRTISGAEQHLASLKGLLNQEQKDAALRELFAVESLAHPREIEPLRLELEEFVASVRESREPKVTGEDGLMAVQIAHQIEQAIAGAPALARAA